MSDYEYAGIWDCEACGASFRVENKFDPLTEALACPNHNKTVEKE